MSTLPEEGELYIGDWAGHPKALHGIMDAVHTIRHERYMVNRDTTSGAGYHWQDHTISLAATIFNGHSRSTGHYAHTARMVYDKHWHGRNRAKNKHLSQKEREATASCHLCGSTDSQAHAFRSCTHNNICAIRTQTYESLQELITAHNQTAGENQTELAGQRRRLLTGILHELQTCTDAARAWTGNWSQGMITRLQGMLEMDNISSKQCTALRKTLHSAYQIISQGANDIMNIRHDVAKVQHEHNRRRMLSQRRPTGQQLITTWLQRGKGHYSTDTQQDHDQGKTWTTTMKIRSKAG